MASVSLLRKGDRKLPSTEKPASSTCILILQATPYPSNPNTYTLHKSGHLTADKLGMAKPLEIL